MTPWTAACQVSLSIMNSQTLFKLIHRVGDAKEPSHSVVPFSFCLKSFPASVFSNESVHRIRMPKYWSFSIRITPSSEYLGLLSFRIDWFNTLLVQGTLKASPTPQLKTINSFTLSFLYGQTLTSIHNYTKNHSFDYIDLCWQSDISAF